MGTIARTLAYTGTVAGVAAALPSYVGCALLNGISRGTTFALKVITGAQGKDEPTNSLFEDLKCTAGVALGTAAVMTTVVALALIAKNCWARR